MKIRKNLQIAVVVVSIPWLVYFIDFIVPVDLRLYGLRPRYLGGLWGIIICPLLHVNYGHLIANTGALFVLLIVSLAFSRKLTAVAVLVIILLSGGLVWLFGQSNTIHIGASGIIFGLIGFLLVIGVFRREWRALAVSAAIFVLYGGAILSLLYDIPGISWEGHASGFLSGVLAAWWTKSQKR
jgi:membrane associated rhomboid family serine protease